MGIAAGLNRRLTRLAGGQHVSRRTVRVRLTLLYGGLFLVSGAALVAITYVLFQQATAYSKPRLPQIPRTPTLQRLPDLAASGSHVVQVPSASARAAGGPLAAVLPQIAAAQYQLSQDQHRLVVSAPKLEHSLSVVPRLAQDQRQLVQGQHQLAQAVNQLAQAVHQVSRAGTVEAAQRASDSHELLIDSGIALAIVAVLALLAGWLIAGRMLQPIRTITRKAQRISSASLHERLGLEGPQDELKELGDTLDALFARLEAAFDAQRQFVANASHELRTPLARQRALIQVALADPQADLTSLRAAHERVLASEQHLEQMIDGLLTLSRGQAELERREQVDLADIASYAMQMREPELAGLEVTATLTPAPAGGDQRLLERLIANLIDNAIRHNLEGGHVEVSTGIRDQHPFVSVANSGPVVPPEQVQRLFQPFQRLDGGRARQNGGHGLGLSIVQVIANAHDAELCARSRPEGGLAIEVLFPLAVGTGSGAAAASAPLS